jgi:signal recognition particle receptor subunit beta
MSFINFPAREITCKIVYYGPGLCGKTTNVQLLHDRTVDTARGRLVSLKTDTERTLFFDFLPLDLGSVGGYRLRLSLYTVPGQIFYRASRKLILQGLDGVVFVADSQAARLEADAESLEDLRDNLAEQGRTLRDVPYVLQYNKRDLPGVVPLPELRAALNPEGAPEIEASAANGRGVFETLKAVARRVLLDLKTAPRRAGRPALGSSVR